MTAVLLIHSEVYTVTLEICGGVNSCCARQVLLICVIIDFVLWGFVFGEGRLLLFLPGPVSYHQEKYYVLSSHGHP